MDGGERAVEDASGGDQAAVASLLARHLPGLRAFVRLRMGRLLLARESVPDLVPLDSQVR